MMMNYLYPVGLRREPIEAVSWSDVEQLSQWLAIPTLPLKQRVATYGLVFSLPEIRTAAYGPWSCPLS